MKLPRVFLPERNLDDKTEELSKEITKTKKPFEESYLYEAVYDNLRCSLRTMKEGPVRIFWVSDKNLESRYEDLSEMVDNAIKESGVKISYNIYDYHWKKFENIDAIKILDYYMIPHLLQIVYVNHEITESLKGKMENLPLLDRAYIITIEKTI